MTTLIYAIIVVAIFVVGEGIIAPALVSSSSDIGVVLGVCVAILTAVINIYTVKFWTRSSQGMYIIDIFKRKLFK